jgi:hypothetical protein
MEHQDLYLVLDIFLAELEEEVVKVIDLVVLVEVVLVLQTILV